jgi:predicted acyltransferase
LFFKIDTMPTTRNESLDALRGLAILTMVLSGSIAFGGVLPAWMYHAQVPPPQHQFSPSLPGITWVDLVFPFFLFSMGAAIPLSLRKVGQGATSSVNGWLAVLGIAAKRFALLAFFALFTQHLKAWVIAERPGVAEQCLSLLAFGLLCVQFYEYKGQRYQRLWTAAKIAAFAVALILLWRLPFWGGKGFDWYKSDIILMVLANMAFFGTLLYYATRHTPLLRIGVLPFVMAIFLAAKEPGNGWAKALFNFSHIGEWKFDWLYKFYFLKYLFIIIPGTLAGEMMMQQKPTEEPSQIKGNQASWLATISVLLVLMNLYGLFARLLLLNLLVSIALCAAALYLLKGTTKGHLYKRLAAVGTYCLLLGLCLEAYEGGIKKDSSTYSYYFVTSGLAFYTLIAFGVMAQSKLLSPVVRYLALNGKNPMVAYVAGSLLLLPLLSLTGLKPYWDGMHQNAAMGLLKGLLFTAVVSLVAVGFVKRGWFWRT